MTDGTATPKILVLGSVNTDHVLDVQSFPTPGETGVGSNYRVVAGGKGANQALACARLGGATQFLACVGDDVEGRGTIASLATDGVDTSNIDVTKNSEPASHSFLSTVKVKTVSGYQRKPTPN